MGNESLRKEISRNHRDSFGCERRRLGSVRPAKPKQMPASKTQPRRQELSKRLTKCTLAPETRFLAPLCWQDCTNSCVQTHNNKASMVYFLFAAQCRLLLQCSVRAKALTPFFESQWRPNSTTLCTATAKKHLARPAQTTAT